MRRFRVSLRGDDGAAAVEFALIFPIFMILAMGLLAAGTAFSRQINITQATREASRYGATYDIGNVDAVGTSPAVHPRGTVAERIHSWLNSVGQAVETSAGGKDNPIGGYDTWCVAIIDNDGTAPDNTTHLDRGGSYLAGGCLGVTSSIPSPSTYVEVVLRRDTKFFNLFTNASLNLDALSLTPYEGTLT